MTHGTIQDVRRIRIEAQRQAAAILREFGMDASHVYDKGGTWIEIKRPDESVCMFFSGDNDPDGSAEDNDMLGFEHIYGRVEDGDLLDCILIECGSLSSRDWTIPAMIAAAIAAAIVRYTTPTTTIS
jgi:hypothetical protein